MRWIAVLVSMLIGVSVYAEPPADRTGCDQAVQALLDWRHKQQMAEVDQAYDLALFAFNRGEYDKARAMAGMVVASSTQYPVAYFILARIADEKPRNQNSAQIARAYALEYVCSVPEPYHKIIGWLWIGNRAGAAKDCYECLDNAKALIDQHRQSFDKEKLSYVLTYFDRARLNCKRREHRGHVTPNRKEDPHS